MPVEVCFELVYIKIIIMFVIKFLTTAVYRYALVDLTANGYVGTGAPKPPGSLYTPA